MASATKRRDCRHVRPPSLFHDHLRQALRQGLERGLITRTELQEHPESASLQEMLK